MGTNDQIRTRITVIGLTLLLLFGILGFKLYELQIGRHAELLEKAKKKYTATKKSSGKRGEIYSRDGRVLVGNAPCVNITADPSILANDVERRKLAFIVSKLCVERFSVLYERLAPERVLLDDDGNPIPDENGRPRKRVSRYALLARDIDIDTERKVRAQVELNRIRGVNFEKSYCRAYPKGVMLANLLGLVNIEGDREVAISGLERFYNQDLSSTSSKKRYERARDGRPLDPGQYDADTIRDGKRLYLTVIEPIQSIMEEELDRAYQDYAPKAVYAIMLDPRTGDVMAIGQRPNFDPSDRATMNPEADRPRLVSDIMEPGSVIKPFTYAYALDHGVITPETRIDCEGGRWTYLGRSMSDTHQLHRITVAEAIQVSSNIAVGKLGLALGKERVYANLRSFGFGSRTNLPIRPESVGILRRPEKWDGLTVTRVPMGYSVSVTPVQMARAYCALANGGKLPQLNLVDRLIDPETGEEKVAPRAEPVQMFRNPATAKQIVDMMIRVTEPGGTACEAAIKGYHVAGKTGTSHKLEGGHYTRKTMATFAGFVPAENPAFVLLVTVDEPSRGGRFGGRVSGPVFNRIGERTLKYLNIAPTVPEPENKKRN